MKILIALICLLGLPHFIAAQVKAKRLLSRDHEHLSTPFVDSIYLGLITIKHSDFKTHIRINLDYQTVDLFSTDGILFTGRLINKTISFKEKEARGEYISKPVKFIYQFLDLDTTICTKLAGQLLSSGQHTLSDKDTSKYFGHPCNAIHFQFKCDDNYSMQHYYCTYLEGDTDTFNEVVFTNYHFLDTLLRLKFHQDSFINLLPRKKRYATSRTEMVYLLGRKEKFPTHRTYMYNVSDVLNPYLTDTLQKLITLPAGLLCPDRFYLRFSKKGRLTKVGVHRSYKGAPVSPTVRECMYIIRTAFRKVKVDIIHPRKHYYRFLSFSEEGKAVVHGY